MPKYSPEELQIIWNDISTKYPQIKHEHNNDNDAIKAFIKYLEDASWDIEQLLKKEK